MDKIKLLQARREKVLAAGTDIRKAISSLIDARQFCRAVPASAFLRTIFSTRRRKGMASSPVFATVDGYPVYIAAQNFAVLHGGACKAGCEKIGRMLALAEKKFHADRLCAAQPRHADRRGHHPRSRAWHSCSPKAAKLHGRRAAVCRRRRRGVRAERPARGLRRLHLLYEGRRFGGGQPRSSSPHKSGKNLPRSAGRRGGGSAALPGSSPLRRESYKEVRETVRKILDILPRFQRRGRRKRRRTLNAVFPGAGRKACTASELIEAVFDADSAVEVGKGCSPEVRCVLGRVGGIAAAAVVFDGGGRCAFWTLKTSPRSPTLRSLLPITASR